MPKYLTNIFLFFLSTVLINAQDSVPSINKTDKERLFVITAGPIAYRGDLSNSYKNFRFNFNASYHIISEKALHLSFNMVAASISGGKTTISSNTEDTNTYFKSSIIGIYPEINWWFINNQKWKGGISGGIGVLRFNPIDQDGNNLQDQPLTRNQDESYGNITAIFPLNFTLQYFPFETIGISASTGFLNPATDYIDNIKDRGTQKISDNILYIRAGIVISK
ncbi:hypothetical protein [Marinigracilibium pacificum]|uniref:Outer membrane protein with beta-barrel domain n=1 Tax=Marinigracilibium pacificum TaxID=2729599 RepID=A0A848J5I6_9BACT|nr:hypothetical protein [Marinigracilibium pacificum]NMM50735.1 hypothetical protein [Marinigracilibium pacificum]